jgi:hypothetical protein
VRANRGANDDNNEKPNIIIRAGDGFIAGMTGPVVKKRAGRLEALPSLRFFAELHIVGFHFYSNTKNEVLNNFNAWGASPLSFFFLLSGKRRVVPQMRNICMDVS